MLACEGDIDIQDSRGRERGDEDEMEVNSEGQDDEAGSRTNKETEVVMEMAWVTIIKLRWQQSSQYTCQFTEILP